MGGGRWATGDWRLAMEDGRRTMGRKALLCRPNRLSPPAHRPTPAALHPRQCPSKSSSFFFEGFSDFGPASTKIPTGIAGGRLMKVTGQFEF